MRGLTVDIEQQLDAISQQVNRLSLINMSVCQEKINKIINEFKRTDLQDIYSLEERICNLEKQVYDLNIENNDLKRKLSKKGKAGRKQVLSEEEQQQIKQMYAANYLSMPKLAKAFNVSTTLVFNIIHDKK